MTRAAATKYLSFFIQVKIFIIFKLWKFGPGGRGRGSFDLYDMQGFLPEPKTPRFLIKADTEPLNGLPLHPISPSKFSPL